MSQEIIRGVLDDHGLFYLGTVMDGSRIRGVGELICAPQYIQHVVYMQDTNLLLSVDPTRTLVTAQELQDSVRGQLSKDYDITYHELGEVVAGILSGDMSYLDWLRLPIINQPNPEYLRKIFVALETSLEDCYLALVERAAWGGRAKWMPLDYRQAQLLAFARMGKIEVNYFTALAHLQESPDGYEVYESATDEVRFQRLAQELRSIETSARRGIL